MAGKLTTDGRKHIYDRVQNSLNGTAMPETYTHIEIGTGTVGDLVGTGGITVNTTYAKGTTALVLRPVTGGGSLTGSLKQGDILIFNDDDTRYEVSALATAAGNLISITLVNGLVVEHQTGDTITTSAGGFNTATGCRVPVVSGSIAAVTTGWPKVIPISGGYAIEFKASFAAGSFTVGTAITEAAVRQNSGGGKCFGYVVLDTPQSPTAAQSLDVTLQFPILAGI